MERRRMACTVRWKKAIKAREVTRLLLPHSKVIAVKALVPSGTCAFPLRAGRQRGATGVACVRNSIFWCICICTCILEPSFRMIHIEGKVRNYHLYM